MSNYGENFIIYKKDADFYKKICEKNENLENNNWFLFKLLDFCKKLLYNITENNCSNEVINTLLELKRRGIKIAIGSSSKNTPKILNRLGIYSYFDAISDGNNITHSKPNPEVFLKAAQFINENPQDCLIVEDAIAGIDAGINGGFKTAAIGDATKYDKPDYKLNKLSDLLDICK